MSGGALPTPARRLDITRWVNQRQDRLTDMGLGILQGVVQGLIVGVILAILNLA
jgi:hypothetical protein